MKIELYSFGKSKANEISSLEAEYAKRLRSFCDLKVIELPLAEGSLGPEVVKREEGRGLLKRITPAHRLIALDERGKEFTSEQFAKQLDPSLNSGKTVAFAIGGPNGWGDEVRKRANLLLSLSKLTMPYAMARLVLIEQIYRASTIISGAPYHK